MGFWIMMIVCILVLDMHDLCALSADSAHVRRWSLPGSINRFVTLVMITLRMDALLDGCDHRWVRSDATSSYCGPGLPSRGNEAIETPESCLMTCPLEPHFAEVANGTTYFPTI